MVLPDQGSGSAQPYRPQSGRAVTADARQHDGAGPLAPILSEGGKEDVNRSAMLAWAPLEFWASVGIPVPYPYVRVRGTLNCA